MKFWKGPEKYTAEQIDRLTAALKDQEAYLTRKEDAIKGQRERLRNEHVEGVRVLTEATILVAAMLKDSAYPAQADLLRERMAECLVSCQRIAGGPIGRSAK